LAVDCEHDYRNRSRTGDGPIAHTVEGGLALAVPALGAFYLIQRRAGHRLIQALLSRFASGREWRARSVYQKRYSTLPVATFHRKLGS